MRRRASSLLAAPAVVLLCCAATASAQDSAQDSGAPAATPARSADPRAPSPPYAVKEEAPAKLWSPALMYSGAAVGGAGLVASLAGLILMNLSETTCTPKVENGPTPPCGFTKRDAGLVTLLVGAPVAALGLTMAIVGGRPAQPATASAAPKITVGLTGGSVHWQF
jgi:hypothetical protein